MSPAHVLEPTYRRIRRRLTGGDWPMGFRLDTAKLAADAGVSTSPVRDSLNRLAGERLVDFTPGDGFHVPWMDDQQLRELLDLNCLLVVAALGRTEFSLPIARRDTEDSDRASGCFRAIGWASHDMELLRAIDGTSSRLAQATRFDAAILGWQAADIDTLEDAFSGTSVDRLFHLVHQYHALRREQAATYIFYLRAARRT